MRLLVLNLIAWVPRYKCYCWKYELFINIKNVYLTDSVIKTILLLRGFFFLIFPKQLTTFEYKKYIHATNSISFSS